ncbi:hypothetical protein PC119_g20073 [Phytophthora cactorum]|nr:hypothetical protein PC119_g20073 [Phytophthora cactorum]
MSSDGMRRRELHAKAKCPSEWYFVNLGTPLLRTSNKDAKAYRGRITAARRRFETFSRRHMIDGLHNEAMEAGIPCAVPFGTACSHCPLGLNVSLSETSPGTRLCVYLFSCVISAFNLNVVTLRVSAVILTLVQALRLHSVLGFVRPHHFRNVLYQNVPRFPCISVGRKSSPTNTKTSLISVRLRGLIAHDSLDYPPSRAAPIAQWWRRGRKDTPPALEQFLSVEFAQLQHELRYQKAQVAQAAQTASNTQVELGSQVVRLHDRVAALEKLTYAALSSSASNQS